MQLSDFSVLNDIFHPSAASSVDPRLVLSSRSYVPPSQLSPNKKDPAVSSSPAPVPLSVQELERVETSSSSSPPREKSPPVDIVHLAAEEIRKPLLKFKDEPKVFSCNFSQFLRSVMGRLISLILLAGRD